MAQATDSYRRTSTGMLVNQDDAHYQSVLQARQQYKERALITTRLDKVEDDLSSIKSMLAQLINKGN